MDQQGDLNRAVLHCRFGGQSSAGGSLLRVQLSFVASCRPWIDRSMGAHGKACWCGSRYDTGKLGT